MYGLSPSGVLKPRKVLPSCWFERHTKGGLCCIEPGRGKNSLIVLATCALSSLFSFSNALEWLTQNQMMVSEGIL